MPRLHRNHTIRTPAVAVLALVLALAGRACAAEQGSAEVERRGRVGVVVVPVADPPTGPSPALEELAHQLRVACRERAPDVLAPREVAERLGVVARTPLADLERTYAAAQAAFQADEVDTSLRLLRGVAAELESSEASPDGAAVHELWVRVQLRIALAERALGHRAQMEEAIGRVLALDPDHVVDPDRYAPSFRREVEEVRRALAAAGRRELIITAPVPGLVAYVDGKDVGPLPAHVRLPPGRYRIAASGLRDDDPAGTSTPTPALSVEIGDADREVALDTAVGAALRVRGGPALAVAGEDRATLAVALGRWASAAQVITVELASEGGQPALAASVHDVGTGALLRQGRAHLRGGSVPGPAIAALASYLLAGDVPAAGPGVARRGTTLVLGERTPPGPPPARWLRPAAYGAGALAVGAIAVAVLQARASGDAYREASAMVRADGALVPGADRPRYDAAIGSGDGARRNAYVAAGASVALAVTAAVLGYLSGAPAAPPVAGFAF